MRRPVRHLRRLVAIATALVVALASAAAAHTSLVAASPEPETLVGGTIDRIDLEFGGNVTEPGIVIRLPDGERVSGEVDQIFTNRASLDLATPLTTPGRYWVNYTIISADGDRVDNGYGFNFDPAAPAPVPLVTPSAGPSQLLLVTIGVAVGFAFVGGFTWLQSRKRAQDSADA